MKDLFTKDYNGLRTIQDKSAIERNSFNEGWYKGFTVAACSAVLGIVLGTIIVALIESTEE